MIIGRIAYAASPSQEDFRVFDTESALLAYLATPSAKAGQSVKLLDTTSTPSKYKTYTIQNDGQGGLTYTASGAGDYVAAVGQDFPEVGDKDLNYYKYNSVKNVYEHYRYDETAEDYIMVGGDTYSQEEIDEMFDNLAYVADVTDTAAGIIFTFKDGTSKTIPLNRETVVSDVNPHLDADNIQDGISIEYTNGDSKFIEIKGGGGGSSTSGSATITRITDSSTQCVFSDHTCPISYKFVAVDSSGDVVGDGAATWFINGIRRATSTAKQGNNTFDVGQYLISGINNIKVSIVVDTGGETPITVTKTWTVNAINMYVEWNYNEATLNMEDTFTIEWTPYGDLSKTTHIIIDEGTESEIVRTSTTSRSGYPESMVLPKLSHGSHMVKLYITATVNESEISTTPLYHDMIFVDSSSTTPIIATNFRGTTMTQYNTVRIPIVAYTPNSLTSNVVFSIDGVEIGRWANCDRTLHNFNYTPTDFGTKTLRITNGNIYKEFTIIVEELDIDNEEIPNYKFKLKASDFAGNDNLRSWLQDGVDLTFSDNFDWDNGGIKTEEDSDGNIRQYICVKAGTRMTINHKPFSTDIRTAGQTFKLIFKTVNCRNYDAKIATCFADNVGFEMYAYKATFRSTGTKVAVDYSDNEYIEFEYDVYPSNAKGRYMMTWLDGVPSSARVYNASDSFTQGINNQKNIVIGSDDCDVYVYLVKLYNRGLSRDNHIENFIADSPNAQEMLKRYTRNDILDNKIISYQKLYQNNPDCRVWLYDIPYMTTGKKDYVDNCIFNQFWVNGDQYYQLSGVGTMSVQGTSSVDYIRGAANTDINFKVLKDGYDNDLLENGVVEKDLYGNNYYVGDTETGHVTVFEVDENTKLTADCIPIERDSSGNVTKYIKALGYKINDDSTPISYSNTKVNFASCEQVNNMLNAAWYQRFQPYKSNTPRDCMEFAMGVQFIKDEGNIPDTESHFILFDNDRYNFYSIANMGTSKKNVHIFHDMSNPNECCVEVMNNLNDLCRMITDDMTNLDWSGKVDGKDHSFEMRYPDTSKPSQAIKTAWQRFVTWMATNNPNAATNELLSEPETYDEYTFRGHNGDGTQVLKGTKVTKYAGTYTHDTFNRRVAKMLSECEDYLIMDSVIYHFVYIERHTMVDSVAKNTFWSTRDGIHWDLSKAYDMDTSDGNNNEGKMTFDYGYEANDKVIVDESGSTSTKDVFNAKDSVWFVFCNALVEACETMFVDREKLGCWSASAYHEFFLAEQRKVPERIWVECYWYDYLRTLEENINDSWIEFLDGGTKMHQRWHYEFFEEIYDSSKYRGNNATANNINFRGYHPEKWDGISDETWAKISPLHEIPIKMYNKCYVNVSVDGNLYRQKVEKGQTYIVDFSAQSKLNDTVINIYSAQMIQEIGNLSRLYPGTLNLSNAKRLRSLTIGSNIEGYRNMNLSALTLGQNTMLEYLYVQNLGYIDGGLDLSSCPSLILLDASGSTFTAYTFANAGLLRSAIIEKPTALVMKNLLYIDDEHFTINDNSLFDSITIENCPQLDTKTITDNAKSSLTKVRLLGIDWDMLDTTLLNTLLRKQGIGDDGSFTPVSVLTGSVHFDTLTERDLNKYRRAWSAEALDITADNLIEQCSLTFLNYDETPIQDIEGDEYIQWVDKGQRAHDPLATDPAEINVPVKPSSSMYNYTFSHWAVYQDGVISDTPYDFSNVVLNPITLIAVYTESPRTFTVNWYTSPVNNGMIRGTWDSENNKNNRVLIHSESNIAYGSEAVLDDFKKLKVTDISSGSTQYVECYNFANWNRSTGNITDDIDVYAIWDYAKVFKDVDGNLILKDALGADKNLKDMSHAEIAIVMAKGETQKFIDNKDYFDFVMGHDYDFKNVKSDTLVDLDNYLYVDGLSAIIPTDSDGNQIKLFAEDSPSFTLAVDMIVTNDAHDYTPQNKNTLLSCFENPDNGNNGFAVRCMNSKNNVLWGDKSVDLGSMNGRDMIVLRHVKGSSTLYVYSFNGNSSVADNYADELKTAEPVRLAYSPTNAPLVFGSIAEYDEGTGEYIASTSDDYLCSGIIYWCKIWYDDLGDTVARNLASWTRDEERQDYYEVQLDSTGTWLGSPYVITGTANKRASASFCSNNLMRYLHRMNSDQTNSGGWGGNQATGKYQYSMHHFMQERFYPAIPNTVRNMIVQVKVPSTVGGTATTVANYDSYVYIPCLREMTGDNGAGYSSEGERIPWNITNGRRLKFKDIIILDTSLNASGNAVHSGANEPIFGQNKGFYDPDTNPDGVREFDIWQNGSNTGYIYLSAETLKKKQIVPTTKITQGDTLLGGWVGAVIWFLRSPYTSYTTNFWNIGTYGATYNYVNGAGTYYAVCPCFSLYAEIDDSEQI